jgi:hypothetical protein
MKKKISTLLFICFINSLVAQIPSIEWQNCLGGSGMDGGTNYSKIEPTSDGGFLVCGYSNSTDGLFSGNHGSWDAFVSKLDVNGSVQWSKIYGGSGNDGAKNGISTSDGGYIFTGKTQSNDGDVIGNHGTQDVWVVKLNQSGTIQWQRSYGGSGWDDSYMIKPTIDNGYIIIAESSSQDGDLSEPSNYTDIWILKINSVGNIVWNKTYGGNFNDHGGSIIPLSDGSFIFSGYSNSTIGDITSNQGGFDYWIVKIDSNGNLIWSKSYGGSDFDYANEIIQLNDGNFLLTGQSESLNGDVVGNHGDIDAFVLKLNTSGNIIWKKCFGGSLEDKLLSVRQTNNGRIFLVGGSNSSDGNLSSNQGNFDVWVLEINDNGDIIDGQSFGGEGEDAGCSLAVSSNNELVFRADTGSYGGDVIGYHGGRDIWVVNLGATSSINELDKDDVVIFPNPTKDFFKIQSEKYTFNTIEIYDVFGRCIEKFDSNTVDLTNYTSGIFIVKVLFNETYREFKVIKN